MFQVSSLRSSDKTSNQAMSWTRKLSFGKRVSSRAAVGNVIASNPQNLLVSRTTTVVVNGGKHAELRPLSNDELRSTLNNKMEYLSITGRSLDRTFARGFREESLTGLKRLVLTGNKLNQDIRVARIVLSNLPASLEHLNVSFNGINAETADVLARSIRDSKTIRSLSLAGNAIGTRGLKSLIEIGNLHLLQEVDLRGCNLGKHDLTLLGQALSRPDCKTRCLVMDLDDLATVRKAMKEVVVDNLNAKTDAKTKVALLEIAR